MSKIHGLNQIKPLTIEDGSIKNLGISTGKLANASVAKANDAIVVRDASGRMIIGSEGTAQSAYLQGVVPPINGGTGVNNGTSTITIGGNVQFSGAYAVTITSTAATSITLPTSGELVNKAYVDGLAQGLDVKASCRVASQANLTLSAPGASIDGVTMVAGDRVLVRAQTDNKENGIYVWNGAAAAMTRSEDADNTPGNEVSGGMFTFVEQGTSEKSGFVLIGDGTKALGTDPMLFSQFSGAGQLSAKANELVLVGTEFGLYEILGSANAGSFGGNDGKIPSYTVDKFGRLTAAGERTMDLNADFGITATAAELNTMDGITSTTTELNELHSAGAVNADFVKLHAITPTAAEINVIKDSAVTNADLVKLHAVTATADELNTMDGITATTAELNELHSAGCTNADFVKLHAITVSSTTINDIVTVGRLDDTTDGASGADMVGVTAIPNATGSTLQAVLESIQGEINTINSATSGMVDYEFVTNAGDGTTVEYTVAGAAYVAGSLKVYINGLLMKRASGAGNYTESDAATGKFTFGTAPATDDEIIVSYR